MLDKLYKAKNALSTVPCSLNHYFASKKPSKYIIWHEMGESQSLYGDNRKTEQTITGTVDYFTKEDMDPNLDAIQNALISAGISFTLESVQYEEETGYIHYEWKFEVV